MLTKSCSKYPSGKPAADSKLARIVEGSVLAVTEARTKSLLAELTLKRFVPTTKPASINGLLAVVKSTVILSVENKGTTIKNSEFLIASGQTVWVETAETEEWVVE